MAVRISEAIPSRTYEVADLFCGAGGSSSGAARAVAALGGWLDLVAVNHWDVAIATHSRNHPHARHHCVNLDAARPEDLVPSGHLDLLMASPECVFFSRARGGKPVNDQRRMSAWHVQRWASALDITCILVENVPEFRDWGPLTKEGRPDPKKKGTYFEAWVKALWMMGYAVEWRLLNAADFGDATTRTRFFLQARKDGRPIKWPTATHSPTGAKDLFGGQKRWRAAREVIDWSNPGRSILGRKKPLSEKTRRRIARGLQRFGGALAPYYVRLLDLDEVPQVASDGEPTPFVTVCRENNVPKSVDDPLQTITTSPAMFVVEPIFEPFVVGQQSGSTARSTTEPLPTIATSGAISLVKPMITPYYGNGTPRSADEPLPTVTTKDRFGLCSPVVVPYGPRAEARDVDEPLPTILTKDRLGVCVPTAGPFVLSRFSNDTTRAVDEPLPTVVGRGAGYLVQPFIVPQFGEREGQAPRVHDITQPLPAVTSHGAGALVHPTLDLADENAVDPRRVVLIDGRTYLLDIRFRMLTNKELARAMGFDDDELEYQFTGTVEEVTKQIGNAVAVNTAAALVNAILGD